MTSCFNTVDARAVVTVQGGIAPYTYQWTGPTVVPNVAQVDLGPGTYSVLVTDALGCSSTATVDVTAPPAIVFDDLQQTDSLACFGAADGIIRSKASGGSGPLTYTLLPGNMPSAVADSGVFLNLPAGDYTIRVTDINDCSFDTIIHIYQRPELVVQVVIVPVIGLNPGSITLTASGGTPPYQYSIDNGATLQPTGQFNNLPAGIYPVYVVDANGCTFTQNVNLTVNELDVTVTKHDVSCFGLADGSFYLATTDGVGPYTLTASWLSAPQTEPSGLFAYTGQSAGLYDIRIEDSQGWLFMDTIEIKEPTAIVVTANITNASCSAITKDGAIDITVTGGTGVYTFTWSNNAITEDLINIEAGKYTVAVNDENGCSSAYYEFEVLGINVATAYAGENDTICPGAEYQLIGSVGDSVSWEPAQLLDNPKITNPTATITTKTSFIYTVYDNGCVDKDTVVIDTYERIGMDIYDPSGEVDIDTALYLLEGETYTMAATPGFVSYLWDPPTYLSDPTLQAVVVAPANSLYYTVFGTTNKGCIETDRVHVVIARPIEIYSGFSPNGDGINDKWVITNGIQYGNRIRVKVFNRWGEPIFESKGYGASQEWDGTRNGRPMPVGAYYYIVDVNDGKSKPYTGTVTILR
jgi:gliding motility-associated-like protein